MSSIPLVVSRQRYGLAFGVIEITDALGATIGNLWMCLLRDQSGNYSQGMHGLLALAWACLLICLWLWYRRDPEMTERPADMETETILRNRLVSVDDKDSCIDIRLSRKRSRE